MMIKQLKYSYNVMIQKYYQKERKKKIKISKILIQIY